MSYPLTPGFLDDWSYFGTVAAGLQANSFQPNRDDALVRRTVSSLPGNPLVLARETFKWGTTAATQQAGSVGAFRNVTGLTIGATYRLGATVARYGDTLANLPKNYQLGVLEGPGGLPEGWAPAANVTQLNRPYPMPVYEFVATNTNHAIAFRLAEAGSAVAGYIGEFERVAIWGLQLVEIASASPYRVQDTVYESSLLNHFDMVANSVGGRWWVDNEGITQFSADLGDPGAIASFTDARGAGKLEYTDISTSFDTRSITNNLVITNHGAKLEEDGWAADDYSTSYQDATSTATWGPRSAEVDTCLYDAGLYEGSQLARANQILAQQAGAELHIRRITWNAQESPAIASLLDVNSVIDVEFRGVVQRSRILSIESKMMPKRWMMTLQLERLN